MEVSVQCLYWENPTSQKLLYNFMLDWKNGILLILDLICTHKNTNNGNQIDSSTIDGNIGFLHSQYSCILSTQFFFLSKLLKIVIILDFSLLYLTLVTWCLIGPVLCLPPIVLVNLFEVNMIIYGILYI